MIAVIIKFIDIKIILLKLCSTNGFINIPMITEGNVETDK